MSTSYNKIRNVKKFILLETFCLVIISIHKLLAPRTPVCSAVFSLHWGVWLPVALASSVMVPALDHLLGKELCEDANWATAVPSLYCHPCPTHHVQMLWAVPLLVAAPLLQLPGTPTEQQAGLWTQNATKELAIESFHWAFPKSLHRSGHSGAACSCSSTWSLEQ